MSNKEQKNLDKIIKLKDKNSALKEKLAARDKQIEQLNNMVGLQSDKLKELGVEGELICEGATEYEKLKVKYEVMKIYAESINEILRKVLKKGQMSNEKIEQKLNSIAEKLEKV